MAAIRCAGRSLLRQSASLLRLAADGGEGRVLQQKLRRSTLPRTRGLHSLLDPPAALPCPRGLHSLLDRPAALPLSSSSMVASPCIAVSSSRYMSSWSYEKEMRKKLALDIMKEHTWYGLGSDEEIASLDELLHLIKANGDPKARESQLRLLRGDIEKKKQEVAILLFKEDGSEEYKLKLEELAAAAHRLRQALSPYPLGPELRELREKYKALERRHEDLGFMVCLTGIPLALTTLFAICK